MLIREFQDPTSQRLAALAKFLRGRAKDTDAVKPTSVETFVGLAQNMGIDVTSEKLQELVSQPPLNNIISDIQDDNIVWKGSETVSPTMSVDQARATVNSMAKRAANKAI